MLGHGGDPFLFSIEMMLLFYRAAVAYSIEMMILFLPLEFTV